MDGCGWKRGWGKGGLGWFFLFFIGNPRHGHRGLAESETSSLHFVRTPCTFLIPPFPLPRPPRISISRFLLRRPPSSPISDPCPSRIDLHHRTPAPLSPHAEPLPPLPPPSCLTACKRRGLARPCIRRHPQHPQPHPHPHTHRRLWRYEQGKEGDRWRVEAMGGGIVG